MDPDGIIRDAPPQEFAMVLLGRALHPDRPLDDLPTYALTTDNALAVCLQLAELCRATIEALALAHGTTTEQIVQEFALQMAAAHGGHSQGTHRP